jgi:glycosyltransferase involved in cell wall biosynthesis
MIDISVVVPVCNEEENLPELVSRLSNTLGGIGVSYEMIFVTDLNRDNTLPVLKKFHQEDKRVKVVKLSNRFGHHVAVYAGLTFSKGQSVVIMDGDLQDYPEDIPKLYSKMKEGFDVVYGIKEKKNDSAIRNIFSKLFVRLISSLSDYKLDFNTSMFRIVSRRTVDYLLQFREREPSLTALFSLIGFPTTKVMVTSGKRMKGETKFSFIRQVNTAINFLLSFSTKPLRIMSMIGFTVAGLSFFYLFVVIVQKVIFHVGVLGWPTIISVMTFLGGLQLLGLGLVGEYIGRIFMETKNRPLYIIEETIGDFK